MEMTELPARVRIARKILKLIALPILILAVVVRFTVPRPEWWIYGTFIALCLFVVVLIFIGRISLRGDSGQTADK